MSDLADNLDGTCPCACHRPDVIEADIDRQLAEEDAAVLRRIRETSYDVAGALDWGEIARRPTHAQLKARRDALLAHRPDTRPTDKAALEHWANTGEGPP